MKPSRARAVMLRRLGYLEAKIARGAQTSVYTRDEAIALRIVLGLDRGDEERVVIERERAVVRVAAEEQKRMTSAEQLRMATAALREVERVNVGGVLERIDGA